jgi:hypothetical protein
VRRPRIVLHPAQYQPRLCILTALVHQARAKGFATFDVAALSFTASPHQRAIRAAGATNAAGLAANWAADAVRALGAIQTHISALLGAVLEQFEIEDKRSNGLTSQRCTAHAGGQQGSTLPDDWARDGTDECEQRLVSPKGGMPRRAGSTAAGPPIAQPARVRAGGRYRVTQRKAVAGSRGASPLSLSLPPSPGPRWSRTRSAS